MKNMELHQQRFMKKIRDVIRATQVAEEQETYAQRLLSGKALTKAEKVKLLDNLEKEMKDAAKALEFRTSCRITRCNFGTEAGRMIPVEKSRNCDTRCTST